MERFRDALDSGAEALIRNALEHNHVVADEGFRAKFERVTKLRVSASCRGRPPKSDAQSDEAERSKELGNLDSV